MVTAKSKLRHKSLDVPDGICTYGCDASEEDVEAAVLAETGFKTPWIRYTLEEFAAELNADLPTFNEEASAAQPESQPARPEASPAQPAQPEAPVEEIAVAPRRRGRPKRPIVYPACKKEFASSDDKYNHVRRGKCVPV